MSDATIAATTDPKIVAFPSGPAKLGAYCLRAPKRKLELKMSTNAAPLNKLSRQTLDPI